MWKKIKCKGKDVWGKCNSKSELILKRGLVEIRYSQSPSAKIYRAKIENISDPDGKSPAAPVRMGFGSAKNRTAEQEEMARDAASNLIEGLPLSLYLH